MSVARPEDILVAYDPDGVTLGDQAAPLEVRGGSEAKDPFPEMTGGADTYYADFTTGLRDFVAARQRAAPAALAGIDGGDAADSDPTLVSGWFGGAGADPSAIVLGVDWLADTVTGDGDGIVTSDNGGDGGVIASDGVVTGDGINTSDGGAANIFEFVVDKGRAEPPYQAPQVRESAQELVSETNGAQKRADNIGEDGDLSFQEIAAQTATQTAAQTAQPRGLGDFVVDVM